MIPFCEELVVAGAAVATAYHQAYSPAVRMKAVCEGVNDAMTLNDATLKTISKFPSPVRANFKDAQENEDTLFNTLVRAHSAQSELNKASFFQRHCKPYFTFKHGGIVSTLSELEEDAAMYRDDAVATSVRAREQKALYPQLQQGQQNPQVRQGQQQQQNQFAQPVRSFDHDLEANLVRY